MRRPLVLGLASVALAGCGAAERQQQGTSASTADRVEVTLRPSGPGGQELTKTITCTTVTDRCRRLREADFSPVRAQACTQVYGGPATATVTGKAGGKAVDAEFELANGCEIDRWRRFAWLLGEPPTG